MRTAVGDNDPGSVGAPALLGSAVEPETSLQILGQQQPRRVKAQAVRGILVVGGHNAGGGARIFHVEVRIAFSSADPF